MKNVIVLACCALFFCAPAFAQQTGWESVEKAFGKKGEVKDSMLKMSFPRSDLKVLKNKVPVAPGVALGSWIGFKKSEDRMMMMGDLVLLESEVAPVMKKMTDAGIQVTALHNHLYGTDPPLLYLHFSGEGDSGKLSEAMKSALSLSATPMGASTAPGESRIDWSKVESVLGKGGQIKGDIHQFGFPRQEKITEKGMEIAPFLGVGTAINMQMIGDKATASGDYVLLGEEVNPVIKALEEHGIEITAVHSHMLFESPRLFFLHFWGYDEPEKVAKGLKAALDRTNYAR